MLSLVTDAEAATLFGGDLESCFGAFGIPISCSPIVDFSPPDRRFELDWHALRPKLTDILGAGGKVLLHCRAGRGRSGMVAAALLVAGGLSPTEAIAAVRRARPGAIETPEQEAWIARQATPPD